jgi:hypothetical protein
MGDERVLGKYRLLELLGKGGFSKVHRAQHTSLGNEVALKILNPTLAQDETFARRFRREARRTVMLDHPNIVRVLDLDEVDGQLFIAMEYVPSQDLHELLNRKELMPLEQVVSIVRQLGAALDYAHGWGLVHRDVKPGNVLVREDGVVKLTDFGLVKAAEGSRLTRTGTTLGTPAYMSPEQTRGSTVDARADLYALGVMAYEFVTGRVPFEGDTPVSVAYMHVHETPPLPSTISSRAEGPIEPVLIKALAKDPAERYQTGRALSDALAAAVYDVEDRSVVMIYDQAITLLEDRHFGEALNKLEALRTVQPDYKDVPTLILKAQEGQKLAELYAQATEHLANARELATQIAVVDPDFPDTEKVLQAVTFETEHVPEQDELARMFDEGLAAFIQRRWLRARNLLNEVEQQRPGYQRSGQRAASLLAEAQIQLTGSRQKAALSFLQTVGRALLVLLVAIVILAGLHVIIVRPAIEETIFDLVAPSLDTLVEAEVFPGRAEKCELVSEQRINSDLAEKLREGNLGGQVEIQLDPDTIMVRAELGSASASITTSPVVITEDGVVDLDEFKINWLVQLIFSRNGLRNFVEGYINDSILRDGRMWLEEVTIDEDSLNVCVTPRSS